jgi:putative transposase
LRSVPLAERPSIIATKTPLSVYRLLEAHELITSPAFIVIEAASEFTDKTSARDEMWQTDFIYLKIIGWGWMYLSTILDGLSRYIIAWKLCTTMKTTDVTDTLTLALTASACDQAHVHHKPRLLSDNGSSYVSGELADWLDDRRMTHVPGRAISSPNPGQDRTLASDTEKPHPARTLLPARRSRSPDRHVRRALQSSSLPREHRQSDTRRRLLRPRPSHLRQACLHKATDHPASTLATPQTRRLNSHPR